MADMISAGDLADMQRFAESRMRDACVVSAPGSTVTVDPETGEPTVTGGPVLYSGVCRVRTPGIIASARSREVAGDVVALAQPTLSLPVSAARVPVKSIVVLTSAVGDVAGHLREGVRFRVVGSQFNTDSTAQRLTIEAVTG